MSPKERELQLEREMRSAVPAETILKRWQRKRNRKRFRPKHTVRDRMEGLCQN